MRAAPAVALAAALASAHASPAAAQQRAEVGGGAALPLAQDHHAKGTRFAGALAGRAVWERLPFAYEAGIDIRPTIVDAAYFQGDATTIDRPWILRTRISVGARYELLTRYTWAIYARAAIGIEHRMSRYTLNVDGDEPFSERKTEQSTAPFIEPGLGVQLGLGRRYVTIELSAPAAWHEDGAIAAHGIEPDGIELDAAFTINVGWSL